MKHLIITISRQYGSGGRQIGKALAEQLAVPFYDRSSLDQIAHERGEDRRYIPAWREHTSSVEIWGADYYPYGLSFLSPKAPAPYYSSEREMFAVQSRLIRELSERQSCVFVGRCADFVLKDYPRCLRVMIGGSEDSRALRAYDEYYERSGSLSGKIACIDAGRAGYYKRCTGQVWGERQNYQLCLDSGVLGVEGCVAVLHAAVQRV